MRISLKVGAGNWFIPEGCLKIAQRFNVGRGSVECCPSPEGTAEAPHIRVNRPFVYGFSTSVL